MSISVRQSSFRAATRERANRIVWRRAYEYDSPGVEYVRSKDYYRIRSGGVIVELVYVALPKQEIER